MAEKAHDPFFQSLPVFADFQGVADSGNYRPLPEGWAIAVADIIDSTGAIAAGRYKSVNMAGASVISALLNGLGQHDLPFVFGGDGAMVAVPAGDFLRATQALAAMRTWVDEELDLEIRAALVPVEEIRAAGLDVQVARFQVNPDVAYAMFSGGGAHWADAQMKLGRYGIDAAPAGTRPDLAGLSCRWEPIQSRHGQIVSIIAVPDGIGHEAEFQKLTTDIIALAAGQEREGHPIAAVGPAFGLSAAGLEAEARARAPKRQRWKAKLSVLGQYVLSVSLLLLDIKLGSWSAKKYRADVAANTDFRKFDDGLKMTLDVDPERLAKIEARLRQAVADGIGRYGLHRQDAALMTCIVPSPLNTDHMHFVDGASGGYAMAATQIKDATAAHG
jgi:hypothetical protein